MDNTKEKLIQGCVEAKAQGFSAVGHLTPFLDEPRTPVRNTAPADRPRPGVVEVAEVALPGEVAQVTTGGGKPDGEGHHVDHTGRFGGPDESPGRPFGIGQGLGDHHMLTVADDFQGNRDVPLVGGADKDGVDVGVFAHLFVVGIGRWNVEVGSRLVGALLVTGAHGDDIHALRLEARYLYNGAEADTDYTHAKWFCCHDVSPC